MVAANFDFDRMLLDIGQFGRFQIGFYILLNLMMIPTGMNHLGQVFVAGSMKFWCDDESSDNMTDTCTVGNSTQQCTSWEYDRTSAYSSTLVSEYNLVCGRKWMQALSQSFYMLGVLIGVIGFGALADRFGRLKILMVTTLACVVFGTATSFMPDYWSFITTRLIVGAAAGGNMTTVFVMSMEVIGGKARAICGTFCQGFFGIGVMILPAMAYYITEYRYLQLAISMIYVVFLVYYWLMPESVRWQLTTGDTESAEKGIKLIARINGKPTPASLETYIDQTEHMNVQEDSSVTHQGNVLDLYRTPNLCKKTLNLQFNWFVNSVVYYGISLLSTELEGNVYINAFISGLTETLSTAIFGPITEKLGRRFTLTACMLTGGIVCFLAIPIPEDLALLRTALAMIGKFFISGSFAIVYVFSAELFPTVVRNVGVGNGSMCARVGGLVAPFIALLNSVWKPLPFIVFGSTAVAAGLLALLLPETLHQKLPDTIEEGEEFGKDQKFSCNPFRKPEKSTDDNDIEMKSH